MRNLLFEIPPEIGNFSNDLQVIRISGDARGFRFSGFLKISEITGFHDFTDRAGKKNTILEITDPFSFLQVFRVLAPPGDPRGDLPGNLPGDPRGDPPGDPPGGGVTITPDGRGEGGGD